MRLDWNVHHLCRCKRRQKDVSEGVQIHLVMY